VGRPQPAGEPQLLAENGRVISDRAIGTLGVQIVRGRGIATSDVAGAPEVIVINQAFAARHFPGEDPIGRQLRFPVANRPLTYTVVGVYADIRQRAEEAAGTELMVPLWQWAQLFEPRQLYRSLGIVMRTAGDPRAMLPAVERAVAEIDARLPLV